MAERPEPDLFPTGAATRAEICVLACAEAFRGDGEIMANPIGTVPVLGGRLARATFEPDLVMTDGEALLVTNPLPLGVPDAEKSVEGWNPYRAMFDVVWSGRRHVMMGATQIDAHGNQNIAMIGVPQRPKAQLLGFRGAPGNTINHATSYWVPNHSSRVFVEHVDVVTGVGYDRAAALGPRASRFHRIPRVVSNLAVLDFETPDHTLRLATVHPGVSVDDVVEATGCALTVPDDFSETPVPTAADLALIRDVLDPTGLREREVPA